MRLRDSYRVPLLLLSCLVTALMFPRACAQTRVGLGALLPATAPLTGAESRDTEAALREQNARLAHEITRFEEERGARPGADGPLANLRYVRPVPARRIAIAARVRHRDASPGRRSFTIDAGRADGVEQDMPVVCGDSLVGIVVTVIEHEARVVRIDDPVAASSVRATFVAANGQGSPDRGSGVARGTGDGDAGVVVTLLRQGDAKPGDIAVTGVGSSRIPEGLVLGEVVTFGDDDRDGSFDAQVRPLRDLDTVNSVLVLREVTSGPSLSAGARK